LDLLRQRFGAGESVMGWEVDSVVRKYIEKAGYAQYFTHRTGHSMYDDGHGPGAHIDSLETKEFREIIKGTLFSIEPGIYLPGEFGIRLECDVFIDHQGGVHVTGGLQDEIVCLL
jgi:Xaa-Pro aminopeptidase